MAPTLSFVFEALGLHEDDFSGPVQNLEIYTDPASRCESIHLSLLNIMHSALQASGSVESVFVNIENLVCFEVTPDGSYYDSESSFGRMIEDVLNDGTHLKPGTNDVMLRRIPNRATMLTELRNNARKIGCSHGNGERPKVGSLLATIADDTPLVIVVGDVDKNEVIEYVDDLAQVSEYALPESMIVMRVVNALEDKFCII